MSLGERVIKAGNSWFSRLSACLHALGLDVEITRNASATLALRVLFVGLEFLSALVLARMFRASGYGAYAFAMACVGLLAIPAALGFDRLLIREVATFKARGEWTLVRGISRRSGHIVLAASIGLAIAAAGIVEWFGADFDPRMAVTLQVSLILVPIVAYARLRQAVLQGLGRVVAGQLPETVVQPLALLCLLGALSFASGWSRTGLLAVVLHAASAAVACFIGIWILRNSLPAPARAAVARYRTGPWIRSAVPFMWMLGMNVIITNSDTIMVGMFEGSISAGVYRVSSQMAMLVAFPLTAVNMAIAPIIASLHTRGDMETLQRQVGAAARAVLMGAVPICLALVVFGRFFLSLFGPEFVAGYAALVILSGGYLLNAAAGASGYLLIMTRHEKAAAIGFSSAASLGMCGNLVLIPLWGIEGAAVATALSVTTVSVTFAVLARRKLGISPIAWLVRSPPAGSSK